MIFTEDRAIIGFKFRVGYYADTHIGADRPGGESAGWISSMVEFVMPVETLKWEFYPIVEINDPRYLGSFRLLVENVSRGTTIFEMVGRDDAPDFLAAGRGDVIRFSFDAMGQGSVSGGIPALNSLWLDLPITLTVPDPATQLLLGIGVLVLFRRRKGVSLE